MFNAGVGGAWSSSAGTGSLTGAGEFAGGLELGASLALIDYGINDIVNDVLTPAQTVANFATAIAESRSVGADPIIVIPSPFGLNPYLTVPQVTTLAAVTTGLQALAVQEDVPIIDLNATYSGSYTTLSQDGLLNSPHPDAALYSDIAARIAALLTGDSAATFPVTANYAVVTPTTVTGTSGSDILLGSSLDNTFIGAGGNDTYVLQANDQTDTIVNGSTASTAPAGRLDVTAATHDQLWLQQSSSNLVVSVLGTNQEAVIQNWYGASGAQLQAILGNDGYQVDSGIQTLVQAMASFASAHPGFNPNSTAYTNLADSIFNGTLATAVAAAWHPS